MIKVKKALDIMKALIDKGYHVNRMGDWSNGVNCSFTTEMWQYCGKEKYNYYSWEPEWLEETVTLEDLVNDQLILVKYRKADDWIPRYFAFSYHGKPFAYIDGMTSYTAKGIIEWNYWKLPEEKDV